MEGGSMRSCGDALDSLKVPWKRAELAVNTFAKTVETDLERMKQLKRNIVKYEKDGNRASVRAELAKTRQTVDQVKRNLKSIQALRLRIRADDAPKFDARLVQIQSSISEELDRFAEIDADLAEYLGNDFSKLLSTVKQHDQEAGSEVTAAQGQTQASKQETAEISEARAQAELSEADEERVRNIAQDLVDVKDMMSSLHDMVHEQGQLVDGIEDNVVATHENVKQSGLQLNKSMALKTASFAVVGAVCGALIGGPVGLIAGAKVGMVAAGAGVAAGAAVGRKIQKIKLDQNAVELQNLNVAADMAETKTLRQEMVTYKSNARPPQTRSSPAADTKELRSHNPAGVTDQPP